jgi:hypothetical protein
MNCPIAGSSSAQDAAYPEGFDYAHGSPHLRHAAIRARIESSLIEEVARIQPGPVAVGRLR